MKKRTIHFKVWLDGAPHFFEVTGKAAKTLLALLSTGQRGVTALELSNTWALRLAAYVHDLRKLGLDIQMQREEHEDGWHGRYILITPVEILDN